MSILSVENLRTCFHTREGTTIAVDDVSFTIESGEVLGIVGESGSGKSVACYSLLGLVPSPPGIVELGSAKFGDQDLLKLNEKELRQIRGNRIAMIFQDPMTSLNPFMRVGDQLIEALRCHNSQISKNEAREKALKALDEVGIVKAHERIDSFPHEFSGGMRQRVMIAMALIGEPELLIADEPTTALDVTVQKQILSLIKSLQASRKLAVIFITHDLGVISDMADHILVMKSGKIVEQGTPGEIFKRCKHPYTQKLIDAIPGSAKPEAFRNNKEAGKFIEVTNLITWFPVYSGIFLRKIVNHVKAVDDVSLEIQQGEIFGLVGESGSGKSTLGRSIIRLIESQSGSIKIDNQDIRELSTQHLKKARRDFQMIFQDPYASLNPRMTVFDTLAEPMLTHNLANKGNLLEKVNTLMDEVGLERKHIRKYPHEFSGGQRQRIAIARALAVEPKFIVADEPVSALDVTIQAQVLELLLNLAKKHNLTMLFISHDLSVVRYICDRVAVMQQGKIVETGDTEKIFSLPEHPYTQSLLQAIPNHHEILKSA